MADEIRSLNGYLFKDESARAANELLEARVEALEKKGGTGGGSAGGSVDIDDTLTQAGKAADAAAVGTRFGTVEGRVEALEGGSIAVDDTLTQAGKAAEAKAVGDAMATLAAQVGAIQPGLTSNEKALLLRLLGGAAYGSADMKASYDALSALWDGGDTPEVVPVQSVTISQSTLTLAVGGTATLTATVLPANSTDRTVVWSVSPSGYATVSGGVVRATAAGSCTVTAACGGKSASCAVTVEAASGAQTLTIDTAANAGVNRVWQANTPLVKSLYVPLTMKKSFKLKQLDFTIKLTGATNIEVSFYNKTKARNEGTNVNLAGTAGDYRAVADCDIDVSAGDEYQIWINSTDTVMCYPSVLDTSLGENEYFSTEGSEYRWNNSKIKYLGYITIEV